MRLNLHRTLKPTLMLAAGILFSCTLEKDYVIDDLSKINTAVTLFGDGISVPLGNSEKITFADLLNDAGENINKFIKTGADGSLSLTYDGTFSLNDKLEELNLSEMSKINGISFSHESVAYIKTIDHRPTYSFTHTFDVTIKNFPPELTKVQDVYLKDTYLYVTISFEGVPDKQALPVEMTITLPDFIYPNSAPLKGNIVNGKFQPGPIRIEKLSGINLTEADTLEGKITIDGTVSTDGVTIDQSQLKPYINVAFNATLQDKDGKIAVSKATGFFSYEFSQSSKINLNDIPAILKSDNVSLAFDNSKLDLDLETNLGVPLTATIELIPVRNGVELKDNSVTINNLKLPCSETSGKKSTRLYSISNDAASATAGKEFIQADIAKLVKQVPDYLILNLKASVDPDTASTLEPFATYSLDLNYGLDIVLSFTRDFKFGTTTSFSLSNAGDILSYGEFGIKGKVTNDSPLNLKAVMELLDAESKVIPLSQECSILINGDSTSDVEFLLSPSDKTRKAVRAKVYITVTAIPDVAVKAEDFVQFLNLVAVIPKGISIQ